MPTEITVSDETKKHLDILLAKMTLKNKTLSELVDIITQFALKHEDELLQAEKLPPFKTTCLVEYMMAIQPPCISRSGWFFVPPLAFSHACPYYKETPIKCPKCEKFILIDFENKCPICGYDFKVDYIPPPPPERGPIPEAMGNGRIGLVRNMFR